MHGDTEPECSSPRRHLSTYLSAENYKYLEEEIFGCIISDSKVPEMVILVKFWKRDNSERRTDERNNYK